MENEREDSKDGSEEDGVEGVRESPGSVGDPDVQDTRHAGQEVAGEVLKVQLVFVWGVEGAPVDEADQD